MAVKKSRETQQKYLNATGPVAYRMTNDYLFKATLQENKRALKGLICAVLHISPKQLRDIKVENPIILGEAIEEKTVILDINVSFNSGARINLEMQVVNRGSWPERSTYYACRNYARLNTGQLYKTIQPVYQISFVDFTVFPEYPRLSSTYRLLDTKEHYTYTDRLTIGVVDLQQIELATDEDRRYNVDKWARLFKATTWEEIRMLAKQDKNIAEAAYTVYYLSEDERIRQQCEAREEYESLWRSVKNQDRRQKNKIKKYENEIAKLKSDMTQKDAAISRKDVELLQKDAEIDELKKALAAARAKHGK